MVALFVLSLFFLILIIDFALLKIQGKEHPVFQPTYSSDGVFIIDGNEFNISQDKYFSKGHTWLKRKANDVVIVGIDPLGTLALGNLKIEKCAELGNEIAKGEVIFEGFYGGKKVKFLSPVNGVVKSINKNFIQSDIKFNTDIWGVQIKSQELLYGNKSFMIGNEAYTWLQNEFIKLKYFLDSHLQKMDTVGVTMFDGGTLTNEISTYLSDRSISEFEKEFLSL